MNLLILFIAFCFFFTIICVKLATQNRYILRGNPKQNGQPVGIGKTHNLGYRFKYPEDAAYYWRTEIGKTSKNIHK